MANLWCAQMLILYWRLNERGCVVIADLRHSYPDGWLNLWVVWSLSLYGSRLKVGEEFGEVDGAFEAEFLAQPVTRHFHGAEGNVHQRRYVLGT